MTQFHQEEQKRFEERFIYIGDGNFAIDYPAFFDDEDESKQTDVKRGYAVPQEFKDFNRQSNLRAMKHILEELLAEIPEDEDVSKAIEGTMRRVALITANAERSRLRTLITKKLQDINLS